MPISVVIDPGHQAIPNNALEANSPTGGKKQKSAIGAIGINTGVQEHALNLLVATECRSELLKQGHSVVLTRESHAVDLSNKDRALIANGCNATCFVQIHFNGHTDKNQHGLECYIREPANLDDVLFNKSVSLACILMRVLTTVTSLSKRWIAMRSDLTALNWAKVPSVLIELGFLTNEHDERLILSEDFCLKSGKAIASAICEWARQ